MSSAQFATPLPRRTPRPCPPLRSPSSQPIRSAASRPDQLRRLSTTPRSSPHLNPGQHSPPPRSAAWTHSSSTSPPPRLAPPSSPPSTRPSCTSLSKLLLPAPWAQHRSQASAPPPWVVPTPITSTPSHSTAAQGLTSDQLAGFSSAIFHELTGSTLESSIFMRTSSAVRALAR